MQATAISFQPHRRAALWLAGLALCGAAATTVRANDKPIRMVLPVGAGSGVDTIMRAAAPQLIKALGGQSVVIENLPGAGGITGASVIVRAPADGLTLGVVSNNHVVNPSVFKKMPFDAIGDITPITVVGATPFVLVVNPKIPAKNAKELQALLKAKPDGYNYASSGNGTIIHLAGAMFMEAAGVDVRHIPYKGVGPMVTDMVSGQVEIGVVALPAVQGQLKSGALRAIGIMGTQRVASLPTCRPLPSRASRTWTWPAGSPWSARPSCRLPRSSACMPPWWRPSPCRKPKKPWPSRRTSSTP